MRRLISFIVIGLLVGCSLNYSSDEIYHNMIGNLFVIKKNNVCILCNATSRRGCVYSSQSSISVIDCDDARKFGFIFLGDKN